MTVYERAAGVFSLRNAARWGIHSSSLGGLAEVDITIEGAFGPACASVSYAEAVKSGVAAPIVVCWLRAPRIEMGSIPPEMLLARSEQSCGGVCLDILNNTPDNVGCLCCVSSNAAVTMMTERSNDLAHAHDRMKSKDVKSIVTGVVSGRIRKAVYSSGVYVPQSDHGVEILAACPKNMSLLRMPARLSRRPTDKSYIVVFSHDWDIHNGRPGYLARNDEILKKHFQKLGLRQMFFGSVNQLPFMGS